MDITVKDNFFKDPDYIRELALSLDHWATADTVDHPQGWRGIRSSPLKYYLSDVLDSICDQIFNYCYNVRDLKNWTYPSWETEVNPPERANNPLREPMLTGYFHQAPSYLINSLIDFPLMKYHMDYVSVAGLIYLTPEPPPMTGTSILDSKNNKMINVKNKYNRFVAYDGFNIHAVSGLFGDSKETNRLTLTFFIHEKEDEERFCQRDEEYLGLEEMKKLPIYKDRMKH